MGWPTTGEPRAAFSPMASPSPMLPVHRPTRTTIGFGNSAPRGATYSSHTRRIPVLRYSDASSCLWYASMFSTRRPMMPRATVELPPLGVSRKSITKARTPVRSERAWSNAGTSVLAERVVHAHVARIVDNAMREHRGRFGAPETNSSSRNWSPILINSRVTPLSRRPASATCSAHWRAAGSARARNLGSIDRTAVSVDSPLIATSSMPGRKPARSEPEFERTSEINALPFDQVANRSVCVGTSR